MKLALKSIPLTAVLLAFAVSSMAVGAVTVGDFVRSTAHLVGVEPATPEGMRAAGYSVPVTKLDARLTEADVVAIGSAIGVSLQTATPATIVNERRAERMLAYLESRATRHHSARRTTGESSSDPRRRPRSSSSRAPHKNPNFPNRQHR